MIFLRDNGEVLKEIDALNMTFRIGEKIVLKAIQYQIREVVYHLDEKNTYINLIREGVFRG